MLDFLYRTVAHAVVGIHAAIGPVLGRHTFASWALSIVFLVMGVRLLLVPAFVKQIHSQRAMQAMQPKMAALREKHKHDKETLNREVMALQKEHGNPLLGCLPILIQIPLFLSLFRVLNGFQPKFFSAGKALASTAVGCAPVQGGSGQYCFLPSHGISASTVHDIASAKAFGVSVSSAFRSKSALLNFLGANATAVKISCIVLIVVMSVTTFLTQRQLIQRSGPPATPQQAQTQKLMLVLAPLSLGVFGFGFPIGVLLYWLTTNVWSLAQQHIVLNRMPPVASTGPAISADAAAAAPRPGVKPTRPAPLTVDGSVVTSNGTNAAPLAGPRQPYKPKKKKGKSRPGGRR